VIVSHEHYLWFCVLAVAIVAAAWIVVDVVRLRRALVADRRRGAVRDQIFGSVLGIIVGIVGVVGVVLYLQRGPLL
jgi:uncharacterized protein YqgC (DUF456 family)